MAAPEGVARSAIVSKWALWSGGKRVEVDVQEEEEVDCEQEVNCPFKVELQAQDK